MNLSSIIQALGAPWAILLALFFLSASIFVHELGHFLAARWRGLVVERFSIGFGPRLWGWKRNGVDWRISAIPLGGYVALPQLADMSTIEGESQHEVARLPKISYTDKVVVAVAGAVFNVLFALAIGTFLWIVGQQVPAATESTVVGYVAQEFRLSADAEPVRGPAWEAGLRPGDKILAVDGKTVTNWSGITTAVATGSGMTDDGKRHVRLAVEREGQELTIDIEPLLLGREKMRMLNIDPKMEAVVGSVTQGSPADRAGFQKGDKLLAIDGQPILHTATASQILTAEPITEHTVTLERDGTPLDVAVKPQAALYGGERVHLIGVTWQRAEMVVIHENPFQQIAAAINLTLTSIGALFNPRSDVGLNDMSGPLGIVHAFYLSAQASFDFVLVLTLLINVNLAIVNLLPIPVLDGGQIVFATIEKLRRRSIPPHVLLTAQNTFMLLILCVFLYITFNDIGRLFGGRSSSKPPASGPVFIED